MGTWLKVIDSQLGACIGLSDATVSTTKPVQSPNLVTHGLGDFFVELRKLRIKARALRL